MFDAGIQPSRAIRNSEQSRAGALFGAGLVAFTDETMLQQLLRWHHFYDKSTTNVGLIWDGLCGHPPAWCLAAATLDRRRFAGSRFAGSRYVQP